MNTIQSDTSTPLSAARVGARHIAARTLRSIAPAYLGIIVFFVIAGLVSPAFLSVGHIGTMLVLASFVMVAAFGEGLTMLTGGLDLSIPWVMTFAGVELTQFAGGSSIAALWAIPLVLLLCAGIGLLNGLGVVLLDLSPVVVTLATNVILQGVVLVLTNGTPSGASPPVISNLMNGQVFGSFPVLLLPLFAFVGIAIVLLHCTTFGRRVYAVGSSQTVARLSGIRVGPVLLAVYAISGFCSGLAGLMLTGYASQSFLGMGDPYLLPAIAAVVVGGTSPLGGKGYYAGTVGGAIMLTVLATILAGLTLPEAIKDIVYGLCVLVAVVLVRE